jgi:aminopeptidase N
MQLLNANSYQKGAWILHMLRREVGDEIFFSGLKSYYKLYRDSNATTEDLQHVFEELSGKKLSHFFKQWLYIPGHPKLTYSITNSTKRVIIDIKQKQKKAFKFPLDVKLIFESGGSEVITIHVSKKKGSYPIDITLPIKSIELDPDVRLLWEPAKN